VVISCSGGIKHSCVRHLTGSDVFEDDLPLFFLGETQICGSLMVEFSHVEVYYFFVLPVDTRRLDGYLDVELVYVFVDVLVIDFNY